MQDKDSPEVISMDPNYTLCALLIAKAPSPFQAFVAKRRYQESFRDWIGIYHPRL